MNKSEDISISIIPAILSGSDDEFFKLLSKAFSFAPVIQIDVMDGSFVPSKSVQSKSIIEASERLDFSKKEVEVHLMVKRPSEYLADLKIAGVKTVIFHLESDENPESLLELIKNVGFKAGVALNPETDISLLEELVDKIDFVMFMTVKPGYYGSPLETEVFQKIEKFSRMHPDILIAADGAAKLDNLHMFVRAGVRKICVGSAIMKAKDPEKAYKDFLEKAGKVV